MSRCAGLPSSAGVIEVFKSFKISLNQSDPIAYLVSHNVFDRVCVREPLCEGVLVREIFRVAIQQLVGDTTPLRVPQHETPGISKGQLRLTSENAP